jgi:hypothetical protein
MQVVYFPPCRRWLRDLYLHGHLSIQSQLYHLVLNLCRAVRTVVLVPLTSCEVVYFREADGECGMCLMLCKVKYFGLER